MDIRHPLYTSFYLTRTDTNKNLSFHFYFNDYMYNVKRIRITYRLISIVSKYWCDTRLI